MNNSFHLLLRTQNKELCRTTDSSVAPCKSPGDGQSGSQPEDTPPVYKSTGAHQRREFGKKKGINMVLTKFYLKSTFF